MRLFTQPVRLWHLFALAVLLAVPTAWAVDTKISALTAASGMATSNELEINESGTSKKVSGTQLQTFVWNAPLFAAGSASANSWPRWNTGGTLLTTPEDGAVEMDADVFYLTTDAGNRGYVPAKYCIRADATRTFTSNTSAQNIFTTPANGQITLETGLYEVTGLLNIGSMSATSGNGSINLLGTGTATVGAWLWHVVGVDGATATAATQTGSTMVTSTTPASALTAGVGTAMTAHIRGSFEVTGAGTLIPQFKMVTAAASVLAVGSYLCLERQGSTSMTSVGQWD